MLATFSLTPGILNPTRYSSETAFRFGIGCLDDLCRNEGLFLDLRAGNWSRFAEANGPTAKRFLMFAKKEGRLVLTSPELDDEPEEEEPWLWEAQAVDKRLPCAAIVTDYTLADQYGGEPKIVSIESLNSCKWWETRSPSLPVERKTTAYMAALGPILKHSKSLMFIDPHVSPLKSNYDEFPLLLLAAAVGADRPKIEIHRASWFREGGEKKVKSVAAWRADFMAWDERLLRAGLKVDVFLWEDVHNRYLISDIVGINVPNGFDVDAGTTDILGRLGRTERDQLQFEYDPANPLRGLVGSFEIGNTEAG